MMHVAVFCDIRSSMVSKHSELQRLGGDVDGGSSSTPAGGSSSNDDTPGGSSSSDTPG
jgi:hypothetical protein